MANLLETWLNSEVELSKKVSNFEEDFSNGYLLGELLYKFNQLHNFQDFTDRHSRTNVLSNFAKMIDVFKGLNVKFDTDVINAIIHKDKGAAIGLIYQLKMALEKTSPPVDITLVKQGKIAEQPPVKCIRPPRVQFDEMERKNIITRLQILNKSQKEIDLDLKMQKFEEFKKFSEAKSMKLKQEEDQKDKKLKDEKRKASINKIQRNAGFMEDWEQKGVQEWKKNMETKKKREKMELLFQLKQVEKVQSKADTFYAKTRSEAMSHIDEFEKTMKSYGIPLKPYKEQVSQTYTGFQLYTTLPVTNQQRDIKRRTMAAKLTQLEQQKESEYKQMQALKKLDVLSSLEDSVANDIWRVTHYTELFIAQRKLREMRYDRRREYDNEIAQLKEQKVLERWIDNTWLELELEDARCENLLKVNQAKVTNAKGKDIEGVVRLIIELTEEVFEFQQTKDSENIDERFMNDWLQQFKAGVNIGSPADEELTMKELGSYLYGKGQWSGEGKFNFKFGDILQGLLNMYVAEVNTEFEGKVEDFPIKLAFIGYPYSGKSCHAGRIQNRYNIEIIEVKDLLKYADTTLLLKGGTVQDEELVRLIVKKIQQCAGKGWILLDFPQTERQCELLEQSLTGYIHPLSSGPSKYFQKQQQLSRIFPPSHAIEKVLEYPKSGLDHILLLVCEKYECLRRCFGKRVDPTNGLEYQVEDDQPPINNSPLIERLQNVNKLNEHRGCIADRISNFDSNLSSVKDWFSSFKTLGQDCLIEINTNRPIVEVGQDVESIVEKLVEHAQIVAAEKKKKEDDEKEALRLKDLAVFEKKQKRIESQKMLEEDDKENALAPEPEEKEPVIIKKEKVKGIWEYWESAFESYKKVLLNVFGQEKQLRSQFIQTLKAQQLDFIEFLSRPSEKQELIIQFQQIFNTFSDENPDMREDPATINELHFRTEDLCNSLWDIIEKRQHEAEEELKEVTKSGQLEGHIELIVAQSQLLLTAEYQKYHAACQVAADYYSSLEQKKLCKCELPILEFNLEGSNAIEIIDKLSEKILNLPQFVVVPEEEKDPKEVKAQKKDAKGKKEEEKVEKSELELEMDECLKKEFEVLGCRVDRIRNWSKGRVKEVEQESLKVNHKMEKWIYATIHAENKAVEVLGNIMREVIEDKSKIQELLELKFVDMVLNKGVIYFEILPPPPPMPNTSENFMKLWNYTEKEAEAKRTGSKNEDRLEKPIKKGNS